MKLYSIEGWWQLCEINDGIIRLLQQWDNIAEMKWVFVGFSTSIEEDDEK